MAGVWRRPDIVGESCTSMMTTAAGQRLGMGTSVVGTGRLEGVAWADQREGPPRSKTSPHRGDLHHLRRSTRASAMHRTKANQPQGRLNFTMTRHHRAYGFAALATVQCPRATWHSLAS